MLDAFIQYPFLQRALIAVVLVGLVCGLMGVFVVFNRMSFFADAVAHSALMGIAIGILLGIAPFWMALAIGVLVALLSVYLKNRAKLNIDTVLGLFLPFSMAMGILLLALRQDYTPDLMSYLFGSVLAVSKFDLLIEIVLLFISVLWLIKYYWPMLFVSFDKESAKVNGINVTMMEAIFVVLLSMIVVVSLQVVGIVLVGALIVIPAAAAKNVARNFGQMFWWSGAFGVLSGLSGLILSYLLDIASGAAIVVVAMGIFVITFLLMKK